MNQNSEISEKDKIIIDEICNDLVDKENIDIKRQLLYGAIKLIHNHNDRLNLKLASAAVTEMSNAFAMFAPFKEVRKVTIFGSARIAQDTPLSSTLVFL